MKKVLSILLVTVMLLTLSMGAFAVPASAETDTRVHPYAIDTTDTEIDIDGTKFTVIRTVEAFEAMVAEGGEANYILGSDLTFTKTYTGTVVAGNLGNFTFEGNGYSLNGLVLNFSTAKSAIFSVQTACTNTVSNLTVNASGTVTGANCGVLFAVPATETGMNVSYDIDNVVVNAEFIVNAGRFGGLICDITGTTTSTITDCAVNGTIDASSGTTGVGDIGGLVSKIASANVTFKNCSANFDEFTAGQVSGCFVSNAGNNTAAAISFDNCHVNAMATGKNRGVGGFIGYLQTTATDGISFNGCSVYGTFTRTGSTNAWGFGGFIGLIQKDSPKITFKKCINKANISDDAGQITETLAGFISAFTNKKVTVEFTDCINVGKIYSSGASSRTGGFCGQPANATGEIITFTRCLSIGEATHALIATNSVTDKLTIKDSISLKDVPLVNNDIGDKTTTQITKDELAAGKAAYLLAEAGADVGQRIGKDAYPVFGSVYSVAMRGDKFVNAFKGNADGSATAYLQLADSGEGVRALFVVKADSIEDITDMQIAIKFNLTNGGTRSRTEDVSNYFTSVLADGTEIYGDEGWVIVGIEVTGVPENAWKSFEFKLTSGDGTNTAYNATASYAGPNA